MEIIGYELRRGCAEVVGIFPTAEAARTAAEQIEPDALRPIYIMRRERHQYGEEIRHHHI